MNPNRQEWRRGVRARHYLPGVAWLVCVVISSSGAESGAAIGIFEARTDVGPGARAGSAAYDAVAQSYTVTGGGENMWGEKDAFSFLWKWGSGDLGITAEIGWPSTNGNPHKKACLVIRESLEPDSAYADVAVHGNGLISLQYREVQGGPTREIQSNIAAPARVGLEKRGDYVFITSGLADERLHAAGGSFRIRLKDPFYVGLAVCAHDATMVEKAVFSKVEIPELPAPSRTNATVQSTLEVVSIASRDRQVIYHTGNRIEAPNWTPDGKLLIFNSKGRLFKMALRGGEPQGIATDLPINCNNDHGISPAGVELAISGSLPKGKSLIYTIPISGGKAHQLTAVGPAYWHGWSPDGKTLAYCAERNGNFDVFTIPVEGGDETRLTTAAGLDDGPEFSPDGKFIYFNSERSGLMQIWRMKPDGSSQEPVTADEYNNWFAHPSRDGKWLVFLSYPKEVQGHPENKDVMLRLRSVATGEVSVLAKLYGGQGTINVPSWSPDSKRLAFVSYEPVTW